MATLITTTKTLLAPGVRGVIGIGRVKTPTLGIVCLRALEIRNFQPEDYKMAPDIRLRTVSRRRCDALVEATLVDAQARVLHANAQSEPNLYWACRGGGGGSFGIAPEFKMKVFPLNSVVVFGVSWKLSKANAAQLFAAWQDWAPNAPSNITSIMKVGSAGNGLITMRCIGQSVGDESEVRNELRRLTTLLAPSTALSMQTLAFLDAVKHFAGPLAYESLLMKAKSDYVLTRLSANGIAAMMAALAPIAPGSMVLLCDSYGGKIADIAPNATAFPRRIGTQYCIQYFSSWGRAADTATHLAQVARVFAAMRPFMPGASYTRQRIGGTTSPDWSRSNSNMTPVIYSTTPRACHSASPPHESQSVLTNSICAHREIPNEPKNGSWRWMVG